MKTFIIGSSHVKILEEYLHKTSGFHLAEHEIKIEGIRGGMVTDMYRYLVDIYDFNCRTVFLQIGSNDIGNKETKVGNVCLAIEQLIQVLLSLHVQHVFVGLLFNRNKVKESRGLTLEEYNDRVRTFNTQL